MNASGNLITQDLDSGIPHLRIGQKEMPCGVGPYGMTVGTCMFFEVLTGLCVILWATTHSVICLE